MGLHLGASLALAQLLWCSEGKLTLDSRLLHTRILNSTHLDLFIIVRAWACGASLLIILIA